jgi:DNA repair ATPase RecN
VSNIQEIFEKYKEAEGSPAWERTILFSWNDMLLLKAEIESLKIQLEECNKQYNNIAVKLRKIRNG